MTTNAGGEYGMTARGIVLAEHDVTELTRLVQSRSTLSRHDLKHVEVLARELDRADVVTAAKLAPDTVEADSVWPSRQGEC